MKKKLFSLFISFSIGFTSIGQNVAKTITFDSLRIDIGSCYINADGVGTENPAIVIDCASGGRLFSSVWSSQLTTAGSYILPSAWATCPSGSAFVLDPVNPVTVTTLNVTIQTMESDDINCYDNPDFLDDCINSKSFGLDITAGVHSFTIGSITYSYTVTQVATATTGLTCGLALPIELINFTINEINSKYVKLSWQTASEKNNNYFTIERSLNGINWEEIQQVDGAGNSASLLSYMFIDNQPPLSKVFYYRLKQTDFDGRFSYSQNRSVNFTELTSPPIEIYPNPSKSGITIVGNPFEIEQIKVFNLLGQDLTKLTEQISDNGSTLVIDLSNLSTGFYFIKTKTTANKIYKQ